MRRWREGCIPDAAEAIGPPVSLDTDVTRATALLDLVPAFPTATWGRDELATGDMWNSNSLTSWLLLSSGHDPDAAGMPPRGRAPGWTAGLLMASRVLSPARSGG